MQDLERCPACGDPSPCACRPGGVGEHGASGSPVRSFALLPCPGDRLVEEEERFTRLLREVKSGVVQRPFLREGEARPLLERMRKLGRLIEDGDLASADDMAGDALDRVLEFPVPARRPLRWRRTWVFVSLVAAASVLLYWLFW